MRFVGLKGLVQYPERSKGTTTLTAHKSHSKQYLTISVTKKTNAQPSFYNASVSALELFANDILAFLSDINVEPTPI